MIAQSQFTLDGDTVYTGFTFGEQWNGWAVPYFERATAERIAADTGMDIGEPSTRPQVVGLYPVGAYEWTWQRL
jgi:hypothetical protein